MPKLTIHCKQQDFRRAGRAWPKGDTVIDSADYSAEQIAQLRADTIMFRVTDAPNTQPTRAAQAAAAGAEAPAPASEKAAFIDRIIAAISQLQIHNPEHWTKNNEPDARALTDILGERVSAKQRDQAWARVQG